MIQKKRINNDVFVRWGVFTPEGLPVDLTEVTSITIEARPQSSNGRYPMVSEVVDNFVEAYFLAKDQKVVGKYNLYLTYTIDDPNIIGGVATYTIDYCDAFELLPKSCFVDGEDDVDPVNIQGIIASFTYSMLTEEEKNDLASRLSDNSGAQNLSDLLDVTISNLEIDQILKYDGTKWVNAAPTGGSSSNVSWGIPTSQYTPLTVNGVTRNLSLNNHTHPWDTITNRPLTDEQFQDLLEIAGLWKLDNDGNLYTERNVYSHGEISAYNWGESPTPPVGVYNLKDLLDVGIINPQEDNILRFNGSHWVNVPSSNVGTLVEWSSETDNYVNLLVGDSSKSISLHGHKHEIEDINNLQDSLDFKQDNIPLGDISQYYRGDKEWATLNTDAVVESTNLYYTPERVIELTGGLYAQKDHTHVFNSLTGLPNTLDGYGIIDAYNKTEIDNLISSTSGFWVKSVGLEVPTGFTVSNSPIIYEGNIKLSFASGYSLPSNSKQYNWDLAFSDRHTHTNINVLNELTIDDVNNWNSIQEHLNDYNNPHKVSFKQLINKPSTLLGYGITDVYSKTEVDYIFNNITPGEPTIKNVYGYDSIDQSFSNDTLTDTFNAYTISRLHDRLTILEQRDPGQGDPNPNPNLDTIINWYNNIGRYWLLDADNDALYTNKNVYSTKELSAYGLGEGGSSGGGADMLDDWTNYTSVKASYYVPASLLVLFRDDTLSRLIALENNSGTSNLELGETSITAYRGDRGKIAYDHALTEHQTIINGTGFVKANGKTLSYDNSSYSLSTHNHNGIYEPVLGNPAVSGYLLSSTTAGARSWVAPYSLPTASSSVLGGVKIGTNVTISNGVISVHNPVTIGTNSNGLSLSNQVLSLALATTSANGALSSTDKTYIELLKTFFEYDSANNAIKALKSFYSTGEVSAYGLGSEGGGGDAPYGRLDAWDDYDSSKSGWALSALLGVDLNTRLSNVEGGSATEVTTSGTGNAITSITKSGSVITATKGSTFSLSTHNHDTVYKPIGYVPSWGEITGKPGTFAPATHTHSNISITAGTGLSGGGALSASRTLSIASTYAPNTSTSLGASQNLNNYQTAGFYHQTANANASTALNYPVASAGSLLVQTAAGVIQTYKVYNSSNVYVRGYYNSSWSAWRKLALVTDNVASATKLQTARNINGTSFDGTAAITTANWGTARNISIGGTSKSVNGSTNVTWATSEIAAQSAIQLATARTINGTSFNGTANITTANWGTARNIGIVNSDGTGTAVTTSVNGSANINLKLPATIKASLTGNASSATKLQTARTIWGRSFDGTGNVSGAITGASTISASSTVTASSFISTATSGFMLTGAKATWANAIGTPSGGGIALVTNGLTLSEANTQVYLAANGNTRIGRSATAPTTALMVAGTAYATGEVTAFQSSDIRLKHTINPITSALDTLDKLSPVSFFWNEKANDLNPFKGYKEDYGLIAQEVENILPNIVHTVYDKYKGIDYIKLVPIMISAIKELKQEINKLKK